MEALLWGHLDASTMKWGTRFVERTHGFEAPRMEIMGDPTEKIECVVNLKQHT